MNLLLTGAWRVREETLTLLNAQGHSLCIMPKEDGSLPCPGSWIEGVVCNGLFLHHSLDEFPNLRYIQLTSAGFDRVPFEQILRRGIVIHNARGVYSGPMAEFALAGVMQLYKQMRFFQKNQDLHLWEKHRGLLELTGKTVCILGCGSVGQSCAKVFSAIGCQVIGVDIASFPCDVFSAIYPMENLDRILSCSDIVICCLPLVAETLHLFEENKFSVMKDDAVFVNISRGQVVHTPALIEALKYKLMGAVLDVFEEEPLRSDHPFWDMENVVLTPHNSFVGERNHDRLESLIINNISKAAVQL